MRKFLWTLICGFLFAALVSCGMPEGSSAETSADSLPETAVTSTTAPAVTTVSKEDAYLEAVTYLEEGKLEEAYDLFLTIKGYRDVDDYLGRFAFRYESRIERDKRYASTTHYEYDAYGKTVCEVYFSTHDGSMTTHTYKYDDNQNLIEEVYQYASSPKIVTLYEYDENNMPVRKSGSSGVILEVEYDAKGNIVKEIYTNAVLAYTYDENGNLLTEIFTYKDGEVYYHATYEYDAKGNRVKFTDDRRVVTSHYDERGNLVKDELLLSDGNVNCTEYEYDTMGNCIKQVTDFFDRDGLVIDTFQYDENGNMTEQRLVDEHGLNTTNAYEQDESGNCIKKTHTDHKSGTTSVDLYEYDAYGNLVKESYLGTTDSVDDDIVTTYVGYRLYYNPYEVRELPAVFR